MVPKFSTRVNRRSLLGAAGGASALALTGMLPKIGSAQDASAVEPYNGEEVTITYGFWDMAQEAAITAQLEAFKVHFPAITVEPQIVPWGDYWTKLQTSLSGGESFDVFWINSASLPVYASAGALLPIDAVVGDGGVDLANFAVPLVEMYGWEGVQYGIPRDFDTIALFYNKDIFDAAGVAYPDDTWTWETFRTVSEQLTDADAGIWGAGLQTSWQENYYNFIYQNGGQLLSEDLSTSVVDSPEASEAFVYLTGFFADELTPTIAIQQSNPVADTLFPAGNVAMLPGGSFRAGTYGQADANIDVAPLPQGKERATVTHGLANVIWSGGANPGAALELVKWLAGEEAETILGESGATVPAHAGLQQPWLDANPDMNLQVFIDALEYAHKVPDPVVGFEWQIKIQEVVIEGFAGNIPAEEIGAQAAAAANEVL
ncbi:MAG: sugar ABC transporter substrate-binding protein [Thermomicrobiales bacterium]|nr:sugar ABC transporter substrate-binding protein [Thermomicrobiales bacterium]